MDAITTARFFAMSYRRNLLMIFFFAFCWIICFFVLSLQKSYFFN